MIYVDAGAADPPAQDGTAWADAFTDLQDALSWAVPGVEIWVAEGTYKPTGEPQTARCPSSCRAAWPSTAASPAPKTACDERDWASHVTVLSGDIGTSGREQPTTATTSSTAAGVTETAMLDGFTISGGNANGDCLARLAMAAGCTTSIGIPTLTQRHLQRQPGDGHGGGMYNYEQQPHADQLHLQRQRSRQ